MNRRTTLLLALATILSACASTKPKIYEADAIRSTKAWYLDFLYEPGRSEKATSDERGSETRKIIEGRPRRDLKLRDDLAFALRDEHKLDVSRSQRLNVGAIRILPVDFGFGGFASLDVELLLANGDIAGRIQIKNGDRNGTFKNDSDFAEFAAASIASAIKNGK